MSGFFDEVREYRCSCKRSDCDALKTVTPNLDARLNELRRRLGRPVKLTSVLRCQYWNEHEGGVADSGHLDGTEADVSAPTSREKWEVLMAIMNQGPPLFTRLGVGKTFIHVGVSNRLAQGVVWTYS